MARILVVEDEQMVRRLWGNILGFEDHQVDAFGKGSEAVEHYKEHMADIDLVILDVLMPEMNGDECFRLLKKLNPDVKAIAVTAYAFDESIELIQSMGIAEVLMKPVSGKDLMICINKHLGIDGAAAAEA